jgi:hypothetical protein
MFFQYLPVDIHSSIANYLKFEELKRLSLMSKNMCIGYQRGLMARKNYLIKKMRRFAKDNMVKSFTNKMTPIIFPYEKRIVTTQNVASDRVENIHVVQRATLFVSEPLSGSINVSVSYAAHNLGGYGVKILDVLKCGITSIIVVEFESYLKKIFLPQHVMKIVLLDSNGIVNIDKMILFGFNVEKRSKLHQQYLVEPFKFYPEYIREPVKLYQGNGNKWNILYATESMIYTVWSDPQDSLANMIIHISKIGGVRTEHGEHIIYTRHAREFYAIPCTKCGSYSKQISLSHSSYEDYRNDHMLVNNREKWVKTVKLNTSDGSAKYGHYFYFCNFCIPHFINFRCYYTSYELP